MKKCSRKKNSRRRSNRNRVRREGDPRRKRSQCTNLEIRGEETGEMKERKSEQQLAPHITKKDRLGTTTGRSGWKGAQGKRVSIGLRSTQKESPKQDTTHDEESHVAKRSEQQNHEQGKKQGKDSGGLVHTKKNNQGARRKGKKKQPASMVAC